MKLFKSKRFFRPFIIVIISLIFIGCSSIGKRGDGKLYEYKDHTVNSGGPDFLIKFEKIPLIKGTKHVYEVRDLECSTSFYNLTMIITFKDMDLIDKPWKDAKVKISVLKQGKIIDAKIMGFVKPNNRDVFIPYYYNTLWGCKIYSLILPSENNKMHPLDELSYLIVDGGDYDIHLDVLEGSLRESDTFTLEGVGIK